MTYDAFRHFADTWGLALLVIVFAMMLVFIFRRGSSEQYRRAARIPMEAPESPAESDQKINTIKATGVDAPPEREDRP
ncbi:cbb3-type cytochrome c oxidase subunit 3 [Acuticoccus sp. I52.16.1]|uniref:cbb3-type cytochrome c oxidase subunit 3 n=1 Tax=Acuticoccus sp. I52.16.1 TaxID=2928472 RepID=UPI001FD0833C|nr:cbb3-type cytochrome c oxidase subunit 3 [Acuticoccus sp. I52.16.1]UOM34039.1 cbb3-type cytochrome c oxidase subunit 3 [Acuticoccus sp. I52.16.1]